MALRNVRNSNGYNPIVLTNLLPGDAQYQNIQKYKTQLSFY